MSRPSARRRLANELTAMVAEGWSREMLGLYSIRGISKEVIPRSSKVRGTPESRNRVLFAGRPRA